MSEKTAIYLTDDEAAKFLLFRKHEAKFKMLEMAGLFDITAGTCTIQVDEHSNFRKIEVSSIRFYK